jgi:transposase InsO family protein
LPSHLCIVEQSYLPVKQTLDKLGVARRTFYRWYDRYLEGGPEALADRPSSPSRVWNRIPKVIHDQIIDLALEQSELSPRELAVRFTDERRYFVSEATVYRLLKAHDLITSPAYVVVKAANEFHTKTVRPNEMWQTDFTYFKIIGWGWMYLSTVLDDFSRYIIAWKLCSTMRAEDVTDTLDLTLPRHRAATRPAFNINRACCPTMAPATSRRSSSITTNGATTSASAK